MGVYWIVVKSQRLGYYSEKYLARPNIDGGRWRWTWTGRAARFTEEAQANSYAVKYKGSVKEVSA